MEKRKIGCKFKVCWYKWEWSERGLYKIRDDEFWICVDLWWIFVLFSVDYCCGEKRKIFWEGKDVCEWSGKEWFGSWYVCDDGFSKYGNGWFKM